VPPTSEDRIRALCSKAIAACDSDDVELVLAELREALHDHIQQMRLMAAEEIIRFMPDTRSKAAD
jgi:hypothetical protein